MPALRGVPVMAPRSRRRSSVFAPAKAGVYGVSNTGSHLPPRPISFAPNVTPITFNESSDSSSPSTPEPYSPSSQPKLFPPSQTPAPPPARKRCPPGKRRSQGYIPRPPNAFMLFRADFVRQKHVPGSIETNHGSLSKIIGSCWRSLPLDEKRVWEQRAKQEKAAHKIQYPNYRFRPVHNKNKKGKEDVASSKAGASHPAHTPSTDKKDKHQPTFEEEIRCEEVTQLLLEGKKGEELAQALRDLEKRREIDLVSYHRSETPSTANSSTHPFGMMSAPQPMYPSTLFTNTTTPLYLQRRPSSVPLPQHNNYGWADEYAMDGPPPPYTFSQQDSNGIALPSVPFLPPPSSAGIGGPLLSTGDPNSMRPSFSGMSNQQRMMLGHRRSSSAGAAFGGMERSWPGMSFSSFGGLDGSFNWASSNDMVLQRDDSALPDADLSLFDPQFLSGASLSVSQQIDPMSNTDVSPAPPSVVVLEDDSGPGVSTNASTTPNGAFNVSELYNGLPNSQHSLGPLDTTGFGAASSAGYWSGTSSNQLSPHQQLVHQQQQQQHQAGSDGLQLEFGSQAGSGEHATGAGQYDQMFLAEQQQHHAAQYGSMMGAGYGGVDAGYDMGAYVNASYGHDQHHQQHQSYVEC